MDAVVEVTKQNFREVLPYLFECIDTCSFVAIDAEFTGLHTHPKLKALGVDTVDVRHCKVRNSAAAFQLLQYGICCFSFDEAAGVFVAKPFSFFLHPFQTPVGIDTVGGGDTVSTVSSSALSFLARNHYDFNRTVHAGLGWLSREAEAAIRAERRAETVWKLRRSFAPPPEEEAGGKPPVTATVAAPSSAGAGAAAPEAAAAPAAAPEDAGPPRVVLMPQAEGAPAPRPQDLVLRAAPDIEWFAATTAAVRAWVGAVKAWDQGAADKGEPCTAASAGACGLTGAGGSGWGIETVPGPSGECFPHLVLPPANGFRRRATYTYVTELLGDGAAGVAAIPAAMPAPAVAAVAPQDGAASAASAAAPSSTGDVSMEAAAASAAPAAAPAAAPRFGSPPLLCWKRQGDQGDTRDWYARLRLTWVGRRKDAYMAHEMTRGLGEVDALVTAAVGFREVIDRITARRCLVVGHNCQLDLAHSTAKFLGPKSGSPMDVAHWAHGVLELFPGGVFDTKQLVVAGPLAGVFNNRTSLSEAFGVVQRAAVEWVPPPQAPVAPPAAAAPPAAPSPTATAAAGAGVTAAMEAVAAPAAAVAAPAPAAGTPAPFVSRYRKRERAEDALVLQVNFPALLPVRVTRGAGAPDAAAAAGPLGSAGAAGEGGPAAPGADPSGDVPMSSSSSSSSSNSSSGIIGSAEPSAGSMNGLQIHASDTAAQGSPAPSPPAPSPSLQVAAPSPPDADLSLGFDSFAHDAGADAAMTGILFLRCAALLASRVVAAAPGGARQPQQPRAKAAEIQQAKAAATEAPQLPAAAATEGAASAGPEVAAAVAAAVVAGSSSSAAAVAPPSGVESAPISGAPPPSPAPPASSPSPAAKKADSAVGNGGGGGGPPAPTALLVPVTSAELNRILLEVLERKQQPPGVAPASLPLGAPAPSPVASFTHLSSLVGARSQLHQMRTSAPEHKTLGVEDAAAVWVGTASASPTTSPDGSVTTAPNSLLAARATADYSNVLAVDGVNKCIDSELVVSAIAAAAGIAPRLIDKNRGVYWVDDRSLFVFLPSHMHVAAVVEAFADSEAQAASVAAAVAAAGGSPRSPVPAAAPAADASAVVAPLGILGGVRSPAGGSLHGIPGERDEEMTMQDQPPGEQDGANGNNMLGLGGLAGSPNAKAKQGAPSPSSAAATGGAMAVVEEEDEYAAWLRPKVRVESFLSYLRSNAAIYGTVCDNDTVPKKMLPAAAAAVAATEGRVGSATASATVGAAPGTLLQAAPSTSGQGAAAGVPVKSKKGGTCCVQ